jgi:hypothetical protein
MSEKQEAKRISCMGALVYVVMAIIALSALGSMGGALR